MNQIPTTDFAMSEKLHGRPVDDWTLGRAQMSFRSRRQAMVVADDAAAARSTGNLAYLLAGDELLRTCNGQRRLVSQTLVGPLCVVGLDVVGEQAGQAVDTEDANVGEFSSAAQEDDRAY